MTSNALSQQQETLTVPVTDRGVPGSPTIYVDGVGTSWIQDMTVHVDGVNWRFLFDQGKKRGLPFSIGLFLDDGVNLYGNWMRYPWNRRVFVLAETPNKPYFSTYRNWEPHARLILTHHRELLARGGVYRRFDFGCATYTLVPRNHSPEKKRLVSFIGSIQHKREFGYELRMDVAERMKNHPDVDAFGRGIREIPEKDQGLDPYAFSIAMENCRQDWYYTEKLLDCFLTETVPIYWGCPSIGEVFDSRGMLTFQSLEELEQLLTTLSWEKYAAMLPYVRENRNRIVKLQLGDFVDYYKRMVALITEEFGMPGPLLPVVRSRVAGVVRRGLRMK
jgi:hypothetical protein